MLNEPIIPAQPSVDIPKIYGCKKLIHLKLEGRAGRMMHSLLQCYAICISSIKCILDEINHWVFHRLGDPKLLGWKYPKTICCIQVYSTCKSGAFSWYYHLSEKPIQIITYHNYSVNFPLQVGMKSGCVNTWSWMNEQTNLLAVTS